MASNYSAISARATLFNGPFCYYFALLAQYPFIAIYLLSLRAFFSGSNVRDNRLAPLTARTMWKWKKKGKRQHSFNLPQDCWPHYVWLMENAHFVSIILTLHSKLKLKIYTHTATNKLNPRTHVQKGLSLSSYSY